MSKQAKKDKKGESTSAYILMII